MTRSVRVWAICFTLAVVGSAAVLGQGRDERGDGRGGGSSPEFSVLLFELRQLRITLEQYTRSQAHTQALASLAVAQQSRVAMTSARLDAARVEFATSMTRGVAIASQLEVVDAQARQQLDAVRRRQLEDAIKTLMAEQSAVFQREQDARRRVEDLAQTLSEEESRWTRAVERLETVAGR